MYMRVHYIYTQCMYVCMYVRTYVCTYVRTYVCMYCDEMQAMCTG